MNRFFRIFSIACMMTICTFACLNSARAYETCPTTGSVYTIEGSNYIQYDVCTVDGCYAHYVNYNTGSVCAKCSDGGCGANGCYKQPNGAEMACENSSATNYCKATDQGCVYNCGNEYYYRIIRDVNIEAGSNYMYQRSSWGCEKFDFNQLPDVWKSTVEVYSGSWSSGKFSCDGTSGYGGCKFSATNSASYMNYNYPVYGCDTAESCPQQDECNSVAYGCRVSIKMQPRTDKNYNATATSGLRPYDPDTGKYFVKSEFTNNDWIWTEYDIEVSRGYYYDIATFSCKKCPNGYYSTGATGEDATKCKEVPANATVKTGLAVVVAGKAPDYCKVVRYGDNPTVNVGFECNTGYYSDGDVCLQCPKYDKTITRIEPYGFYQSNASDALSGITDEAGATTISKCRTKRITDSGVNKANYMYKSGDDGTGHYSGDYYYSVCHVPVEFDYRTVVWNLNSQSTCYTYLETFCTQRPDCARQDGQGRADCIYNICLGSFAPDGEGGSAEYDSTYVLHDLIDQIAGANNVSSGSIWDACILEMID